MIRWPKKSARAISILFQSIQSIDIFVEDQGDEIFYTLLFKKLATEGIVISRVIALGGAVEVRKAAEAYQDQRVAMFMIDGDLPWVRGDADPDIPRLHRLNCYCIENLLVVQRMVVEVCAEELMCDLEQAEAHLKMDLWCSSMELLLPLFSRFSLLNRLNPAVPTVGDGYSKLVVADSDHKLPKLCAKKIENKISFIQEKIEEILGVEMASYMLSEIELRTSMLGNSLHIVSGKDFLLPMLFFHVKCVTNTRMTFEQFRYRLGSKSTALDLIELRRALSRAA